MKNLIKLKHVIFLFFMVSGITLLHSCAVYTPYYFKPVTVPDIVQMSKDKVPSKNIINEIKKSHTAYTLKASEYAKLQKSGVADSVVDYMQKTHLDMIRHNQQMQNSYYWGPGFGDYWYGPGFGWPYGYGYWGWNYGPSIIFRGGGYHGGGHGGGHARR
jgi:hypothetical protein